MNTNEIDVVKALRDTDFHQDCDYCEHSDLCKDKDCVILQAADEIERLQKELDAAVADMKSVIHNSVPYISACDICSKLCGAAQENADYCDHFEWRGRESEGT